MASDVLLIAKQVDDKMETLLKLLKGVAGSGDANLRMPTTPDIKMLIR